MTNTTKTSSKSKATHATKPIVAGIDLGNGYVKANIEGLVRVFPSITVKQFNTANNKALLPDEIPTFMANIIDQMDVSITSPLVQSTERRLFGDRALKSGLNLEEFDVYSRTSKAEVDLSGALALSTIAADRLSRHYQDTQKLPDDGVLRVRVNYATALPIIEHKKHEREYKTRYENNGQAHVVTFHNFENPVRVEITFDKVFVANEGESAQYGLRYAGDAFLGMIRDAMLKRVAPEQRADWEHVTGRDIVGASNTLGIDIGEGTIDFAVFSNGQFNPDASSTLNQGYGTVLETTLTELQNQNYPYHSRKELSEFIHNEPSVFTRAKWNHVVGVNNEQENRFADVVSQEVSKVFNRVGGFIEVIFVFGGGATPLEWALYQKLQERVGEFGESQTLPIVYLDSKFSRFLNLQGLYQVASRLENFDV